MANLTPNVCDGFGNAVNLDENGVAITAAPGKNVNLKTSGSGTPQINGGAIAPLASPTFTGVPKALTAVPLTNNTQIATTAYVDAAVAAGGGGAVLRAVTTLTAAQVLALGNPTPVQLVPAPGAGKYINVLAVTFDYHFVSIAYASLGSLEVLSPDSGQPQPWAEISITGFLDQTESTLVTIFNLGVPVFQNDSGENVVNGAVVLISNLAVTSGNGTLRVTVIYTVETAL